MNNPTLQIVDETIKRQINLMRFTAGERKKVLALLDKMQKELIGKLANDLTDYSKARVNKLIKDSQEIIDKHYANLQTEIEFDKLAKQQVTATASTLSSVGLEAAIPTEAVLRRLVQDNLVFGAPAKKWWEKQSESTIFNYSAQIRQGVVQGETLQQIIKRVVGMPVKGETGIMALAKRNASTLVHDSVMQIANDARMATYEENSDMMKGYEHLSTLDGTTSKICLAYSGAQWDLDYNPIKGNLPFNNGCPRHPNCRSNTIPLLKTFKELGINAVEPKGTRASDEGQVPSDITMTEFLKGKDKAYLDDLLGKGRADLFSSGKITLRDLVSGNGRELTLEQLQGK